MTDTAAEQIVLEAFDPGALLLDANTRTGAEATVTKADVALCKTIAATRADGCGNFVPVTLVRRPDGQLRVRTGHRRTIGCQRAGVPVLGFVAGDEGDERADQRARLIEQWTENHHRQATTLADDAVTVLALFDDGAMTEAGIAKATGRPRPQVAASLAVARSEVATKAGARWEFLDLFQAATLAEFEGDEQALGALVQAARDNPGQFGHVAAQLRATRDEREAKAAFTAELQAQGLAIYSERPYVPWTKALENLRDGDGNQITPEAHATCPSRAVTITYDWDWAPGAEAAYRARTASPTMTTWPPSSSTPTPKHARPGSCPAGRSTATCAPTRTSTATPTSTARPPGHTPRSRRPPRTRPRPPPARPRSGAGSGRGTSSGGPRPRPARPTSRRCWAARPRRQAR
jgi:ParB family chromosome partitioning protein